jgi:hypothetical protein
MSIKVGVRLTARFIALIAGALVLMLLAARAFGDWAMVVGFPLMLKAAAVGVLSANDQMGVERSRDLARRDRRAWKILGWFFAALVGFVAAVAAVDAVFG